MNAALGNANGPRPVLDRFALSIGEAGVRQWRRSHAEEPESGMGFDAVRGASEVGSRCEGGNGREWSEHTFTGDRRDPLGWQSAAGVALAFVYHDPDGMVAELPHSGKLLDMCRAAKLGSVGYASRREFVTLWAYNLPVTSRTLHRRAVEGACARAREALAARGLLARDADGGRQVSGHAVLAECVALDASHPFRDVSASLHSLSVDAFNPWELTASAPELAGFGLAGSSACPVCGAAEAFGRSAANPSQWVCLAPEHEATGCGVRSGRVWLGDAGTLEAWAHRDVREPRTGWRSGLDALRRAFVGGVA